jgi:glycosyltransferase involved in cell wall biosynthesis
LLVIVNQAANYLTIGLANEFAKKFDTVSLVVGSINNQGELLAPSIKVHYINRWHERPSWKKAASYLLALIRVWFLLWTRNRKHEVLFVSVPPMGYLLNLFVLNRFSMIIWDLYPDTFKITGMMETHPVYRMWARLNRWSFRNAYRLYTISEVMADAMTQYVNRTKIIVHPIWSLFPENQRIPTEDNRFIAEHQLHGKFVVQYSGNIGLTHNVELLIEVAERLKNRPEILFQIIGRGPRQPYIERVVKERNLENVQLLPFQSDEMFPHSLSAANLGVVILDSKVSKGSVPSKAYNLMSFGIPSLYIAGKDSELFKYAERFNHATCFSPDELDQAAAFIVDLANDSEMQLRLSANAEIAATFFQPSNAQAFVDSYFSEKVSTPC